MSGKVFLFAITVAKYSIINGWLDRTFMFNKAHYCKLLACNKLPVATLACLCNSNVKMYSSINRCFDPKYLLMVLRTSLRYKVQGQDRSTQYKTGQDSTNY